MANPYELRQAAMMECLTSALHEERGFHILASPTGSGKTTCCVKVVADLLVKDPSFKLVYVTPLKDNRNEFHGKLTRELVARGRGDLLPCNLPSNKDGVTEALRVRRLPPPVPAGNPSFQEALGICERLVSTVSAIETQKKVHTKEAREVQAMLEASCDELERDLRGIVKRSFSLDYQTFRNRCSKRGIKAIAPEEYMLGSEGWSLIPAFWRAALLHTDRVIVVTPQKLMAPCDTIVRGLVTLTSRMFLTGRTVVFDEPDRIKRELLSVICRSDFSKGASTNDPFDLLYRTMSALASAKSHMTDDVARLTHVSRGPDEETWLDSALALCRSVCRELGLDMHFDSDAKIREPRRDKIMSSSGRVGITLTKGDASQYYYRRNEAKNVNVLSKVDGRRKGLVDAGGTNGGAPDDSTSLALALRRARGAIEVLVRRYFLRAAFSILAALSTNSPTFSLNKAASTLVMDFGLPNEYVELILKAALTETLGDLKGAEQSHDLSVYARGVEFTELEWGEEHYTTTSIWAQSMSRSPETIVLSMASVSPIVMLGATASTRSVLNFNYDYLARSSVGVGFAGGERGRRRLMETTEAYNQACRRSYDVNVVEATGGNALMPSESLLALNAALGSNAFQFVIKVASAACEFAGALDKGCVAGCAFLSKGGRGLKDQCENAIRAALGEAADRFERFYALAGNWNEDSGFENGFKRALESGRPALLVTTHATAGVGRNVQVPCALDPDSDRFVGNVTYRRDDERDIDFLFVDKPSYMLPQPKQCAGRNAEGLGFGLFIQEELVERHEISCQESVSNEAKFASAFWHKKGDDVRLSCGTLDLPSSRAGNAASLAQAVGRCSRTARKRPTITIALTADLLANTDFSSFDDVPMTREWEDVARFGKAWQDDHAPDARYGLSELKRFEQSVIMANSRDHSLIRGFLSRMSTGTLTEPVIREWKTRRIECLSAPSLQELPLGTRYQLLVDCGEHGASSYWYEQAEDYSFVNASLSEPLPKRHGWTRGEVSDRALRYDVIRAIPELRGHFEKRGFATSIERARYLISPIAANNILKGAVGEQVALAFLSTWFPDVVLDDLSGLPDVFEAFDYQIEGTGIFIDAKNFRPQPEGGRIDVEHVLGKLERAGGTCALVLNAFSDSSWDQAAHASADNRVVLVPYLYDITTSSVSGQAIETVRKVLEING